MQMKMVNIKNSGGLYTFYSKQTVNSNIQNVWDFFSKTKNIEKIMPKKLKFKNTSGRSSKFYEGKIVGFKFILFKFIPVNIQSEIKKISHNRYFIDNQIYGPYKFWHHEHHFHQNDNQTVTIIDKVKYKLYLYPFSKIIYHLIIKKQLKEMFSYRNLKINQIFSQ